MPESDWLAEGMVVRQGLTLIYGESQVGKTTFCLYLIDALNEGKTLFGRKCKKAKVLLIEQDQSPPMLRGQKRKLGRPKKLAVVKGQIKWNNTKKEFEPMLEEVLTFEPDVVIIDAYTSLGIDDINHPSAGLTFDALRALSQEYNCTFVLTHHTNKKGGQRGNEKILNRRNAMAGMITTSFSSIFRGQISAGNSILTESSNTIP